MAIAYLTAWVLTGAIGFSLLPTNPGIAFVILLLFAATGAAICYLAITGGAPFTTNGIVYVASRWAHNNLIFPTQVAILPGCVTRYKRRLVGADQESINIAQIASVKIHTHVLWSDITIESTGGLDPIIAHGHYNTDALAIKTAIESQQQRHYRQATATPADPTPSTSVMLHIALLTDDSPFPLQTLMHPTSNPKALTDTLVTLLQTGGPGSRLQIQQADSP